MPTPSYFVTDHSPNKAATGDPATLRRLYADIKKDDVELIRFDFFWKLIEPEDGRYDSAALDRHASAIVCMHQEGLESPIVILSNIPKWALKLYKKDPARFFDRYRRFVGAVRESLAWAAIQTGEKISWVQVLNELNNKIYTPIPAAYVQQLARITRDELRRYNPELKLTASLIATNMHRLPRFLSERIGQDVIKYLNQNKEMLRADFDAVSVDYYPGMWHFPCVTSCLKRNRAQKRTGLITHPDESFGQLGLLRDVMETLARWGIPYEIGEVGLPTALVPWKSSRELEDRQRYFYAVFFRALKHLLNDMKRRGCALPTRVGLYAAMDEDPKAVWGGASRLNPEPFFGMRRFDMSRKEILLGRRHSDPSERSRQPSQLKNIIRYMNAPLQS